MSIIQAKRGRGGDYKISVFGGVTSYTVADTYTPCVQSQDIKSTKTATF
jgi:hypothetical protein